MLDKIVQQNLVGPIKNDVESRGNKTPKLSSSRLRAVTSGSVLLLLVILLLSLIR